MGVGDPPLTLMAVLALLLLLLGVGLCVAGDDLLEKGEGEEPFLRSADKHLNHGTTEGSQKLRLPPEEVPPDFFCHSCQEASRKVEKFLSDPSLYDHANNLSSEVCHVMHSNLQIKCRRLVELYLHEAILLLQIAFSEKNLCNSTGFCPQDDHGIELPNSPASPDHQRHGGGFPSVERRRRPSFLLPPWKQPPPPSEAPTSSMQQCAPVEEPDQAKVKSKTCNTCHTVADIVAKQLEDHDQQIVIMQALLDACDAFKIYVSRCKVWVFEYGPILLSNIHRFIMLHDVCRIIHFCAEPIPPRDVASDRAQL